MSHTAATLSTPHASRRRPVSRPAARERVGAVAGIVGAVGLVLAMFMLASTPGVDSSPAVVRDHLSTHDTIVMTSAYLIIGAALLLVPFLVSLGSFTARRTDAARWRWALTVVAGAIAITMLSLAGGLLATATVLANRSGGDEAVHAVFVAAKLIATLSLLAVAGLLHANARAITRAAAGPLARPLRHRDRRHGGRRERRVPRRPPLGRPWRAGRGRRLVRRRAVGRRPRQDDPAGRPPFGGRGMTDAPHAVFPLA